MKKYISIIMIVVFTFSLVSCVSHPETTLTTTPNAETETNGVEYDPNEYYRFGNTYYGYNYPNPTLEQQFEELSDSDMYVKKTSDQQNISSVTLFGETYDIKYSSTLYSERRGFVKDWFRYYNPKKRERAEFTFHFNEDGKFIGYQDEHFSKTDDIRINCNIDGFNNMTKQELKQWGEEKFSFIADFSRYTDFEIKKTGYITNLRWDYRIKGYATDRCFIVSIQEDGYVFGVNLWEGTGLHDINFEISEEQKTDEINKVLSEKCKTESTEYAGTYDFPVSGQAGVESIMYYEGKFYLYMDVLYPYFRITDDSCEHKNWFGRTDVLIPLDDYIVTGN